MQNRTDTPAPKDQRQAFSSRQRLLLFVVPPAATLLIRLLCCTLRFETLAASSARPVDQFSGPDIYAFWHRCLLLAAYRYRDLGARILISQSFDGELIARIVQRLGFVPVRGSSSRGGAAGLLALSRALADGLKVAVTVDGPKGPAFLAKPGAASIAMHNAQHQERTFEDGQTISPFYLHPSRFWTLRSWDKFLIPKPFARVRCTWVSPVLVTGQDSVGSANARLQTALEAAVAIAESA